VRLAAFSKAFLGSDPEEPSPSVSNCFIFVSLARQQICRVGSSENLLLRLDVANAIEQRFDAGGWFLRVASEEGF
jgi:hypothetical protein